MPYWDLQLEWVPLHLLLHLCDLAHLLAEVGLVLHSTRVLSDVEEAVVELGKLGLVAELLRLSLWEPISAVPTAVASLNEVPENRVPLASGTNQTDIQVCQRTHWT